MIRFVGNNADGLPQKRSQSLRACDNCRKRKKRCMHYSVAETSPRSTSTHRANTLPATPTNAQSSPAFAHGQESLASGESFAGTSNVSAAREGLVDDRELGNAETDDGNEDRFVGDLNPESIFFAATSPHATFSPGDDHVGIWIPRKAFQGFQRRPSDNVTPQSSSPHPLLSNIMLAFMQRVCHQMLPPANEYAALYEIYLHEIHPLFPIIDINKSDPITGDTFTSPVTKQAICLAASASPRASGHLKLLSDHNAYAEIPASDFGNQLASAIRTSVDTGFVKDPVVVLQVLTVVALFTQFSHQSTISADITARAISCAQTLGLHLDVPTTRANHEYLTRLFCCVWAIDKLNAAFQGRPTMLHAHDFGRDLHVSIAKQEAGFQLLLRIIGLLDATIALYRPATATTGAAVDLAVSFEDLLHQCNALRVASNHLATIELLYHAVIMLSHRSKVFSSGQSPAVELRETMSATSVVSILWSEYQGEISHLPFAPYALSLSLRVFYRELRFSSKSPFTRNRAQKQLLNGCRLLREMFADAFPSAMKVADLAEQTVNEMEKVYNNILQRHAGSRSTSDTVNQTNLEQSSNDIQVRQLPTDQPAPSWDVAVPDEFPLLDVFEFFDSDFHLDEIDATLVENMAPTYPYMANEHSSNLDIG